MFTYISLWNWQSGPAELWLWRNQLISTFRFVGTRWILISSLKRFRTCKYIKKIEQIQRFIHWKFERFVFLIVVFVYILTNWSLCIWMIFGFNIIYYVTETLNKLCFGDVLWLCKTAADITWFLLKYASYSSIYFSMNLIKFDQFFLFSSLFWL